MTPHINKITGIYFLQDPRSNEVRYVGRSMDIENRFLEHAYPSALQRNEKLPLYRWIAKLKRMGMIPIQGVLQAFSSINDEQLNECERYWIKYYRDIGSPLLNLSEGGFGCSGYKYTEEQRKRRSEQLTGRKMSEASRKKMIMAQGTPIIDNLGHIYISAGEAARTLKISQRNIWKVLNKQLKYTSGYSFAYLSEGTPKIVPKHRKIVDELGNFYNTSVEAAKANNISPQALCYLLKSGGTNKHGKKFFTASNE